MIQQLLLIALVILIFGLSTVVLRYRTGLGSTFSQRVARDNLGIVFYCLLFLVVSPILFTFFDKWFVPYYDAPSIFLWCIGLSLLAQVACTLFPELPSRNRFVEAHRYLAGISGLLLLPALFSLLTVTNMSALKFVAVALCVLLMIAIILGSMHRRIRMQYALLLQIGYYALFFAAILTLTYV